MPIVLGSHCGPEKIFERHLKLGFELPGIWLLERLVCRKWDF